MSLDNGSLYFHIAGIHNADFYKQHHEKIVAMIVTAFEQGLITEADIVCLFSSYEIFDMTMRCAKLIAKRRESLDNLQGTVPHSLGQKLAEQVSKSSESLRYCTAVFHEYLKQLVGQELGINFPASPESET
jgi:hypothetical protein